MTAPLDRAPVTDLPANNKGRDRTHWLYLAVIFAVIAGVIVGLTAPSTGKSLTVLGTVFVNLIKMMIAPVIFCTIVLGIGSVRKAAAVSKVGGLALAYFLTMSSVALGIGLIVGNLLSPGRDLHLRPGAVGSGAALAGQAAESHGIAGFIQQIIPRSLPSALTEGNVLQVLLVALLVGFAVQGLGPAGESILRAVENLQKLVFKVLVMVLWLAPIGAFGAIANIVATTGFNAVTNLLLLMAGFYLTCVVFVFGVLGVLLRIVSGLSIFRLLRYLAREYLLIFATSSSEVVLPRLITKMKHLGVQSSTVGVVVPTGYSFNLDGTAIYLTMASLFIADAMGHRLTWGEQIALLAFMIIASKGAAGVSGAGLATLAGGLQAHRPELLDGVGLIVGIDRFMSEARSLTNFSGNAVATILVASWTKTIDLSKADEVLRGRDPFDESTMVDPHDEEPPAATPHGGGVPTNPALCDFEQVSLGGLVGRPAARNAPTWTGRGQLRDTGDVDFARGTVQAGCILLVDVGIGGVFVGVFVVGIGVFNVEILVEVLVVEVLEVLVGVELVLVFVGVLGVLEVRLGGVVEVSGRLIAGLLGEFGSGLPGFLVTATSQRGQARCHRLEHGMLTGSVHGDLGDHAPITGLFGPALFRSLAPPSTGLRLSPSRRGRIDRVGVQQDPAATAVRTRCGERFDQSGSQPLASQLHQPQRRHLGHLVAGAIAGQRLGQPAQHQVAVGLQHHVDEVDDHDAADIAQPQLAHDLLGRFQIVLGDRLLEVAPGSGEFTGVDVNDRHGFGPVDHQRPARRQPHLAVHRFGQLLVNAVHREDVRRGLAIRPVSGLVLGQLRNQFGSNRIHVFIDRVPSLVAGNDEADEVLVEQVTDNLDQHVRFFVQRHRSARGLLLGLLCLGLDLLPAFP